jgi:predicted nucleic acid-binding protein
VTAFVFPDTTVLVNFALINRMDLLGKLLRDRGRWCLTVSQECESASRVEGRLELLLAKELLGVPWEPLTAEEHIDIRDLRDLMARPGDNSRAHLGEAETIVLMESRTVGAIFVTDDADAARQARYRGLTVVDTWDLIRLAVRQTMVDVDTAFGYALSLHDLSRAVPHELREGREAFEKWCEQEA